MTMVDLQAYRLSIATASELALTAVAPGGNVIKSLPDPRLIAIQAFSADCQYGALHSPEAFPGSPDPAVRVCGDVKAAYLLEHKKELPQTHMIPNSTIIVRGYQDSGGAQVVDACLQFAYGVGESIDPKNPPAGRLRAVRIASSGNMTASTWTSFGTGANAFQGNPTKKYAILGACAYAANGIAVRFSHSSFMGLNPGQRATSDVALGTAWFDTFAPVFNGAEPLGIEGLDSAAEAMNVIIVMWEMD